MKARVRLDSLTCAVTASILAFSLEARADDSALPTRLPSGQFVTTARHRRTYLVYLPAQGGAQLRQ